MEKKSKKGRENSRYIPRCSHNRRVIATDRDRGVIAAELSRGSRLIVNSSFASAVDKLYHGSSISTRRFTHSTAKENAIACSSVSYTRCYTFPILSLSLSSFHARTKMNVFYSSSSFLRLRFSKLNLRLIDRFERRGKERFSKDHSTLYIYVSPSARMLLS